MYKAVDAGVLFRGAKILGRVLHQRAIAEVNALDVAMKVRAAALTKKLLSEIRGGGVAGNRFAPLSVVATRRAGRFLSRTPFTRSSATSRAGDAGSLGWSRGTLPVRYSVRGDRGNLAIHIGFVDTRQSALSRSWKRLLLAHQRGFSKQVSRRQRRWAANIGMELSGYRKTANAAKGSLEWSRSRTKSGRPTRPNPKARYFFWRKSVTTHTTPARPIIAPFWRANKAQAWSQIRADYRRKLSGERI